MTPLKSASGRIRTIIFLGLIVVGAIAIRRYQSRPTGPQQPRPDLQSIRGQAESGDPQAANSLGELYAEGKQIRQSYAEAAKWYRVAADRGLARAQYNIGVLYEIGQSVPRDESEAAQWYRKAAEQGYADAQYNLAAMYGLGRGVPHDNAEALKWYQRAAEQGDALAHYNLAERYERGKGVTQNLVEAYKWHSLAADRGLNDGAIARDKLKRILTSAQLSDAENRIREFKLKYPATVRSAESPRAP